MLYCVVRENQTPKGRKKKCFFIKVFYAQRWGPSCSFMYVDREGCRWPGAVSRVTDYAWPVHRFNWLWGWLIMGMEKTSFKWIMFVSTEPTDLDNYVFQNGYLLLFVRVKPKQSKQYVSDDRWHDLRHTHWRTFCSLNPWLAWSCLVTRARQNETPLLICGNRGL